MRFFFFAPFLTLAALVAARLPIFAECDTLDLGVIPCEAGAACMRVNETFSQCQPVRGASNAHAARRSQIEARSGHGGQANMINGTPYVWKLIQSHSYQMNEWEDKWPREIAPFSVAPVYVEFRTGVSTVDDAGEATYQLDGTPYTFQVQARGAKSTSNFMLQVQLLSMSTLGNALASTIALGWNHDGFVNFALAGTDPSSFVSSNPPQNWIQSTIGTYGNVTLGKFVLPGSHDSGMYLLDGKTVGSKACNTLTQTRSIGAQLAAGARYFDIRPVISGGKFKTGHYSEIDAVLVSSFQGGNGEGLANIVAEVNDFTKDKAEIIVLRMSHDLNTDVGNSRYRPFNQAELDRLFAELKGIKDLYIAPMPEVDLTTLTLNELTSDGTRSAVILLFRLDGEDASLGDLHGKGFFEYEQLNAYNEYSDTDDLREMASDQLQKMYHEGADGGYFLLSWTLTQQAAGALVCPLADSILDLSKKAIGAMFQQVLPAVSKNVYPKLLYIDNFVWPDMVPLALAISNQALLRAS
ncbi:PLC-like phosphodiesterase [Auricularia subglabra TFB-10046 SS5]|nr:PLC-like phosphodiesterase [Auricularia subglabra TFB-10046 SS5]